MTINTSTFQPIPLPIFQMVPLESPFGWFSESYSLSHPIQFFPEGATITISFSATRISKILGYIPIIGTLFAASRLYESICEYKYFNNIHLHSFSTRSVKWIVRSILELVPVLGGIVCLIVDLAATIFKENFKTPSPSEDKTPCGLCHR